MKQNNDKIGYPRVVVSEDEPLIALDLREVIESMGGTVCGIAETAHDAIALVATTAPDLLLMDIHLDGEMDGIKAVQQIRRFCSVPVLFISANWRELRGRGMGDEMVIGKPFLENNLRQAIRDALG